MKLFLLLFWLISAIYFAVMSFLAAHEAGSGSTQSLLYFILCHTSLLLWAAWRKK